MSTKLTRKQSAFVLEYLIDLNATQAAIRAGYSERTARDIATENLAKPNIQEAVQQAIAERTERTEITADKVVKELAKVGFADMDTYASWGPDGVTLMDSDELPDGASAVIAEVSETTTKDGGATVRFKLHDKLAALDKLAKHLGMYMEHREPVGGPPIQITRVTIVLPPGHEQSVIEGESVIVEGGSHEPFESGATDTVEEKDIQAQE